MPLKVPNPLKGSRRSEDLEHRIDSVKFTPDPEVYEVTCLCGQVFDKEGFRLHRVPFDQATHK